MVVFNHHRLDDKVDYLLSVWKKISSIAIKEYPLISSFMISYIMVYCAEKKNKEEALFNAREFLRLLDEENVIEKSSDIYNSHFNKMRVYASKILHKINAAHSAFKDIGRNQKVLVKYGDAEPVFKKFKQVQADLFEERCSLVKVL
jgi:hypothetical protein